MIKTHTSVSGSVNATKLMAAVEAAADESNAYLEAVASAMRAAGVERVKLRSPIDYTDPCAENPKFAVVELDQSGRLMGIDEDNMEEIIIADQGAEMAVSLSEEFPWDAGNLVGPHS